MKFPLRAELVLFFLLVLSLFVVADSVDLQSGGSYLAILETFSNTQSWAGVQINNDGGEINLVNSASPIDNSVSFITSTNTGLDLPGDNIKGTGVYYAAMHADSFDISNVQNASASDILEGGIFSSSLYPQFYPDWSTQSDTPEITFCDGGCAFADVEIGGTNYSALTATLGGPDFSDPKTTMYLLKYNNGGTVEPLFLTEFDDVICYDSSPCVGQFLLPLSSTAYEFFALSKFPVYNINVSIDGDPGNRFDNVAQPYIVELTVFDIYTNAVVEGIDLYISETNGKNFFIPFDLSGYVSTAYAAGISAVDGTETFVFAPTNFPVSSSYEIWVGTIQGGILQPIKELTIDDNTFAPKVQKPIADSSLSDKTKSAVNSMIQISSFMFNWANGVPNSFNPSARLIDVTYTVSTGNITFSPASPELKTGGINVLNLDVVGGSGYTARVVESQGFLLMSPYVGSSPLTQTDRSHSGFFPEGEDYIVTPTDLSTISAVVTIEIYDNSNVKVAETTIPVDSSLGNPGGLASNYESGAAKLKINGMLVIVNSLFVALN